MNSYRKNIIVLNLKNAIYENLEYWFLEDYVIKCDSIKNYIRKLVNENSTSENPVEYVFLINDTILGFSCKNEYSDIKYSNFLIDDLILLKPVLLTQLELYRSVIIDWIFNHHLKNELVFKAIQSLQEFEVHKHQFSDFASCVCVIDAVDLGFKLNDFFAPLNQKFKNIHQFFCTQYEINKVLKQVNLTKVFFIDQLVLGYTFQMEGSSKEHFFWSIYLEEQLFLMDKITFDTPLELKVDTILDKINLKGIENISITELEFLNKQQYES